MRRLREVLAIVGTVVSFLPLAARSQAVEFNADHTGGMMHPVAGRPSFEVAVVRVSQPGAEFRFGGIGMRFNRLEITGTTLKDMIEFAYGVPDEKEFMGGPGWVRTQRFDVTAVLGGAESAILRKQSWTQQHEAMRVRLQVLLEQRFGLGVSFLERLMQSDMYDEHDQDGNTYV